MFGDPVDNPRDWETKGLLELGKCKNGMNFSAGESGVNIHCLGVGDFKDYSEICDTSVLPKISLNKMPPEEVMLQDGDIVFVRSNGNKMLVGRCLVIFPGEIPTTYSGFCIRFRKETECVDTTYLVQLLKADSTRSKMAGRGANIQNLNQQILGGLQIPIPPIELQQEFKEFIKQSDKSKFTGFKSQFIEMFGDLVDNPMGWPISKLSDVAKVDGTMTKEYEKYADYPHIGIDSIEKNTGILSGYRTVQEDNVISPKYYFGPQHILYSKIRPALNKVALPDFEGLCSADCYPLLVTGMCDRKFLAHVMRSDYFLDYVLSYSGRSQMPKVNRKQLEGFSFPCPPIELQEKFTVLIDQSDKSK
jgi:restriction endonuclease S subunit